MRFKKEARQQYIIAYDKAVRVSRGSVKRSTIKHPPVLEQFLAKQNVAYKIDLGIREIPTAQVVGFAAADRKEQQYSANFMPLFHVSTEDAQNWCYLYQSFLSDGGLRTPIRCYEYLGKFYVLDGAKRVSVLKHYGAATVFSEVIRIMPVCTQDQQIQTYYAFLHHYRLTQLYQISFSCPAHFAKLQAALGHAPNYKWNDMDRFGFLFHWHAIEKAFYKAFEDSLTITAADALVLLLEKYTYSQIIKMPVWVLTRVFQANWKQMYDVSEKREHSFADMLVTA